MIEQIKKRICGDVQNPDSGNNRLREGRAAPRGDVKVAAYKATGFLLPLSALGSTVLLHLVFEDNLNGAYAQFAGDLAVLLGLIVAFCIWWVFAYRYRRYATAVSASQRNYNGLRERFGQLKNRVQYACPEGYEAGNQLPTDILKTRQQALAYARELCNEIEQGLEGKGEPWTTGLGYIELWHRVHRAEEALVKVEPHIEALGGAMRDESRLTNATMDNKESLLERLRCAVALLDDSGTDIYLSYVDEPETSSLTKEGLATPNTRAKALKILSEVRYEINNFRDNALEGTVHARNRLRHTSVVLGIAAYALLGLAIFADAPNTIIIWVVTYFLVGAIIGLFARAQGEWSANTAVDDFGLSSARLIHTPWLSGLAAVGGVLITSILDSHLLSNNPDTATLDAIFQNRPSLLIVAAVFGLTPDLVIRRLTQQVDKYKEDLESTQSSQSTEDVQTSQRGQRRQDRRQAG
jgi:hypothetical protein